MIYLITNQKRISEDEEILSASIKDVLDYFEDKDIIEVDTETEFNTRNPKHLPNPYENKVICLQLGDSGNQYVIDTLTVDIQPLKVLFEDKSKVKIFCNAFFDLRFIHHWKFNIKNVFDVFLAECVINKGLNLPKGYRGLSQLSQRYLGEDVSKEIRGQIHWRGLDTSVIKYAAGDVCKLTKIREKQLICIKELNQEKYLNLENRYVIDLSKVSYKGFKLDPNRWLKIDKANKEEAISLLNILDKWLLDKCQEKDLYEFIDNTLFGTNVTINWNSSKQVSSLFNKIGIDTTDKKTGKQSVDIKLLIKQVENFDILPIYIKYKETDKEISTYGENFVKENINTISGRIHSEFFQILDSSRISSNNPNLQNIPSEKNGEVHPLRTAFVPENGNIFVVSDFSQQEPRITAEYSQDPFLADFIKNGDGDSHNLISTIISEFLLGEHVKVTKKNNPMVASYNKNIRTIGKMINLGLDYGKSAFTIKDDLKISLEEAENLLKVVESRTPVKSQYFKKCQNFVKRYGYVISDNYFKSRTNFYGHSEWIELGKISYDNRTKDQNRRYYKLRGEMERFSQNNPIQNTGALMTKLSHIFFNDWIESENIVNDVFVVNLIHDEIVCECKIEIADAVSEKLKECMERAGEVFCKTIPIKAEPKITKYWSH